MLSMRLLSDNYRHAYLLAALLMLVALRPFVTPDGGGFGLIDGFLGLALLTAVANSAHGRATRYVAIALGMLVIGFRVLSMPADSPLAYTHLFFATMVLFCGLSAVLLLVHLFEPKACITTDTILGAVNAYLLLGIGWACGYSLLECLEPGSFDFGERVVEASRDQFWTFIGFSYTTLTTLGYGNISPMNARADALATCEAMLGQFYVAILVGRLVALQLNQRHTHDVVTAARKAPR